MPTIGPPSSPDLFAAWLRSYAAQLRGWANSIAIQYVTAVVLLLTAGASLIAATGVGIAALFRWLEANYGTNAAYCMVAGLLVLLGLLCALAGVFLLRSALPRPPRRKAVAGNRSLTSEAMLALSTRHKALLKADPVTEVMIGVAAACLVGWLVASRTHGRGQ